MEGEITILWIETKNVKDAITKFQKTVSKQYLALGMWLWEASVEYKVKNLVHVCVCIFSNFVRLGCGYMSQSTNFLSCWDRANSSWVLTRTEVSCKCLAQGLCYTVEVGIEPRTSCFEVL